MRRLGAIVLVLLIAWSMQAGATAPDVSGATFDPRPGARLPMQTRLVEADGRPVTLADAFGGKPAVIALVYYRCPNLCGVVRDDLFAALRASGLTGADYTLVLVSSDPHETAQDATRAMAEDRARFQSLPANWHFLTGPSAAIASAVGFRAQYDSQIQQFIHPAGTMIATADGVISGSLLGVGYEAAALERAVRAAGASRIGATPSPILLLCFHYDPTTGRYSLAIERVVQVFAALTVLTLGATLALAHGRTRP